MSAWSSNCWTNAVSKAAWFTSTTASEPKGSATSHEPTQAPNSLRHQNGALRDIAFYSPSGDLNAARGRIGVLGGATCTLAGNVTLSCGGIINVRLPASTIMLVGEIPRIRRDSIHPTSLKVNPPKFNQE